ncbi:hypothetical protein VNO80_07734 [Phaseolus coccineus]|uniref:Uncharacterized protein n=1 Tax=Phaseolus coccineus TaxID=3886 RepID=A0AAN9NKB9_PHACN
MVEGSGRLQMQAPELLHNPVLQRSSSHSKEYTFSHRRPSRRRQRPLSHHFASLRVTVRRSTQKASNSISAKSTMTVSERVLFQAPTLFGV